VKDGIVMSREEGGGAALLTEFLILLGITTTGALYVDFTANSLGLGPFDELVLFIMHKFQLLALYCLCFSLSTRVILSNLSTTSNLQLKELRVKG
jgi:hypothetical protein